MNILFFSQWSIDEGITQATIFPILETIAKDERVDNVILCTVERHNQPTTTLAIKKAVHNSIQTSGQNSFCKMLDLIRVPVILGKMAKRHRVDLLWCRGAPAGGMGSLVNFMFGIPFVVDSFEPHSEYMLGSGTWKAFDPKFLLQRWMEKVTKKKAARLLPVSHAYLRRLTQEGVDEAKLFMFPCVVDIDRFSFNHDDAMRIRRLLSIDPDRTVGIYVGKYGGLYYDDEAFFLYKLLFDFFGEDFFLVLLTETDHEMVRKKLNEFNIPLARVSVSKVKHEAVPAYLAAADFSISTIKPASAMRFCSPIKHGEYWAADLPILTTLPVGDDAEIIKSEGGGIIINGLEEKLQPDFQRLKELTDQGRTGSNARLASRYRNPRIIAEAIDFILKTLVTK